MAKLLAAIATLLCLHQTAAFSCDDVFFNVTALIYRDAASNYSLNTVRNYRVEFQNVYSVETEPINTIPKLCKNSISNLPKLKSLAMVYNGIVSIDPGAFNNVPGLRELRLSYNKLLKIQSGVFNKLPLKELYLTGNKIYIIDENAFDDMPDLELLDLSFNQVQFLDNEWFKNTPKITKLNFVYNYLTQIPPNAFKNLEKSPQKISFWFLNNTITTVHRDAFKGIKNIGKLWLSSNKLRFLDDNTFGEIKQIDSLNLENNDLFCLSDRLLNNTRATEIHLAGNPIICNCLVKVEQWGLVTNTKTYNSMKNLDKCGYKSKYPETTTKGPEGVPIDL